MKPEPDDNLDDQDTDTRLAAVERRLALNEIEGTYGLDSKRATKVYDLAKQAGLASQEAIAVLRERREPGFDAATEASYASLAPRGRGGPQPKPDDREQRRRYVQSLRHTDAKTRNIYLDNMIGGHLADALGWEHHLLPLPPSQ